MSRYNYQFDMKYTDNPYIDLIVNCVKILGMNMVTKNENQALHYEDIRSTDEALKLMKFKEGAWNEVKDGSFSEQGYMEWNSYYRMLNGLPPAYTRNDELAYLEATGYSNKEAYEDIGIAIIIPELYYKYFIDTGDYYEPYAGIPVHELTIEQLSVIDSLGILAQIREDHSDDSHYQYLYHLGDKRIDFYTARKAANFSLLYLPSLNTFDIIENKFRRMYDRNRRYTISTVYSEAYRTMSYHYDAFIQILIIIQTMVDMISEVQEYIINKDVFDSRTIRYLFESYGIAYYKEIPVKYQIRIIKNVNLLLKYKSSNRNIMDILELFDDDTIIVYTYYLMKTKKLNRNNFYYYTADDVNPKYDTNRVYYIGNPKDMSSNKIPLINVLPRVDDTEVTLDKESGRIIKDNFIRRYLYNYILKNKDGKDVYDNREITIDLYQPIASRVSEELNYDSFLKSFLDKANINTVRGIQSWFGSETFNIDSNANKNKNEFLSNIKLKLAEYIKYELYTSFHLVTGLNQYNYKKIKYKLYSILGIFNYSDNDDYDNMKDSDIEAKFYNPNMTIEEAKYSVTDYERYKDDYVMDHSVPFMVWHQYPKSVKLNYPEYYIFSNNSPTNAIPSNIGSDYEKYTKVFREDYFTFCRILIEDVFKDFEYDVINNPTPRYVGWIDVGNAVNLTNKNLNEIQLGDEISTVDENNIPVYNTAFVNEVITEDMIGKEYFRKNYNLCFLKVPILDPNAYKVIDRKDMRRNYDTITLADPFWDGVTQFDILTDEERDKLHQSKKQQILAKEFTIERTKYIAVEASIDLVKMSYQVSYFMNMLFDKHLDEESLIVEVDNDMFGKSTVKLNDILTFAIALNFMYNGVEPDNIASDMEKNMYINGFNFDTDWNDIYNNLQNTNFINYNYANEIHDYTFDDYLGTDGNGDPILVPKDNRGYGLSPMMKGWMTEIYDDFFVYDADKNIKQYYGDKEYGISRYPLYHGEGKDIGPYDYDADVTVKVGAFLSGRYEKCTKIDEITGEEVPCNTSQEMGLNFGSSDIWNYNLKKHPTVDVYGNIDTIDISWDTQYPDSDNNSHGLWLNTEIIRIMNDEGKSNLEKMNMLKKIYYSNTNLYNHLTYMMRHAESKRMYDIYKVVFDSFMETKMNHDYYALKDAVGNQIYEDPNDPDNSFSVEEIQEYEQSYEGFPIFSGLNLNTGEESDFTYYHNSDFSRCYYENYSGIKAECLINKKMFEETGRRQYITSEDINNNFYQKYYMYPDKDGYIFSLKSSYNTYLVSSKDSNIRIPVELDSYGNVKDIDKYKFVITENPDGTYTIEKIPIEQNNPKAITITRKIAKSYYDFMESRDPSLYALMMDLKNNYQDVPYTTIDGTTMYIPSDDKKKRIETICEYIVIALERYFDKKEWRYIFNLIPTANIENIQSYIMKMVVFFKSWKTQILDTAVNYIIDDPYNNHVQILDDMYYNTKFDNLLEKIRPKDYKYFLDHTKYKDPIDVNEKIDIDAYEIPEYKINFGFGEKMYGHKFDYQELTSKLNFKDKIEPGEKVYLRVVKYDNDVYKADANGNVILA